ncbi:MAG: sigma-54 dependent transcriptional regulator [Thermodesulfobacteriota bacterium]
MRILIVDDEEMQRQMLAGFLVKHGQQVVEAASGEAALELFQVQPVDLLLLDLKMAGMAGDELLARLKEINPLVRAIMITAYADVDTAVRVMALGADDFMEKPLDLARLLVRVEEIASVLAVGAEAGQVRDELSQGELPLQMVGSSPAMNDLLSLVGRMAITPWTVLISGETGTGKELVARLLHLLSPRKNEPFVAVNCAAVPGSLFESELFGHERGAFTGAEQRRLGRFEQAHGGTIFLDEVGELDLALQTKLLRVLQEQKISRLGSEADIAVDVRVVAASNRDLRHLAGQGGFREDLYYRLNVLAVHIPPLRERRQDIPELIDFFLAKYGSGPTSLSGAAQDMLIKYPFPGNVRELEHLVQRLVTLARSSRIELADLPPEIRFAQAAKSSGDLKARLQAVERQMISEALEENDWVQTRAAARLGISERVLRYKMARLGIHR